jgi:hypothetical protein
MPSGGAVDEDVRSLLERLTETVEQARAVPMSASCVVNRAEVLELLAQLRSRLPQELSRASAVLEDREAVLAEGRAEVDAMLDAAREERARVLAGGDLVREAQAEATRLLEDARAAAEATRVEVDDYCDAKLANFEIVLTKTLAAVQRGRDKLSGRHELDSLAEPEP